jgi:hypothetical protein
MSTVWNNPNAALPQQVGGFGMDGGAITIDQIKQMNGMPSSCYDFALYDSFRIKGGTAMTTIQMPTSLFAIPQGIQTSVINDGTQTYFKAFSDTNMIQAKQIPKGRLFQVNSLQIKVRTIGALPSISTSGNNVGLPTNGGFQTNFTPPFSDLNTLLNQCFLRFHVGTKDYIEGTLDQFPSAFGITGAGMGAATTASLELWDGVAQNGFGQARLFTMPYFIPDLMNFQVDFFFYNQWTPASNYDFVVYCILDGWLYEQLQ